MPGFLIAAPTATVIVRKSVLSVPFFSFEMALRHEKTPLVYIYMKYDLSLSQRTTFSPVFPSRLPYFERPLFKICRIPLPCIWFYATRSPRRQILRLFFQFLGRIQKQFRCTCLFDNPEKSVHKQLPSSSDSANVPIGTSNTLSIRFCTFPRYPFSEPVSRLLSAMYKRYVGSFHTRSFTTSYRSSFCNSRLQTMSRCSDAASPPHSNPPRKALQ